MNAMLRGVFVVGMMLLWNGLAFSQPGVSPNEGQPPGAAPISGIEILVALGGLLGVKKLFDSRKKN